MTSSPSTPAISLPDLADGHTPSSSPAGQQLDLFGQPLCPASPSARPASKKARKTKGTSGPCSFGSSASAALQSSLASRLIQTMAIDGSPEYVMTWKRRATLSGAPICRLAARARRTSEAACSGLLFGWATATASDSNETANRKPGSKHHPGQTLTDQVSGLAGYPTPEAGNFGMADVERMLERRQEAKERTGNGNGFGLTLGQMVPLVFGYTTPRACDEKGAVSEAAARDEKGANGVPRSVLHGAGHTEDQLPNQAVHLVPFGPGTDSKSSSAGTASPGASLNPWFSARLMGYPPEWMACRPKRVTRSRQSPGESQDEGEP